MLAQRGNGWEVTALLDWEFALAGPALYDVALMLRHEHQLPQAFAADFIARLAQQGVELHRGWHQPAKLLDLFNLYEFPTRGAVEGPLVRDVRDLIELTLRHWDIYAFDSGAA